MVTERFVIDLNREKDGVFEAPIMTNDKHSVSVCVFQGVRCSCREQTVGVLCGT